MANFGMVGLDWQQRVNWDRLRKYRLERARERMKAHGLGAMLLMYDENVRYVTSTLTPGWNRLKPGLRYALLCGDDAAGAVRAGRHRRCTSSGIRPGSRRKTSAIPTPGSRARPVPPPRMQVTKFTNAIKQEMKKRGVDGMKLGVDFIDINMIKIFEEAKIKWADGMTPMMEARAVKNAGRARMHAHGGCHRRRGALGIHEVPEARAHREPADGAHHGVPLQHPRHGGRGGRDRLLGPQHLAQLAQLLRPHHQARRHGVHGSGRAYLERLQILLLPHLLRGQASPTRSRRTTTRSRSSGSTIRSRP